MERLSIDEVIEHCKRHTERMESHSGRMQLEETPIGNSNIMKQYWEHRQVAEWLEQLKSYEDAEEQGLLLRLPCKEETTVWTFDRLIFRDKKACKDCIYFGDDGLGGCCDYEEDYPDCTKVYETKFKLNMFEKYGKTVFLTKEEAEQALKQIGE